MSLIGEGTTTVAVGDLDGKVVLQFPKAVQWASLDPEQARQIGEAMARSAYKVVYGHNPVNGTATLSDGLRQRLHLSATHMIRSLTEQGKRPGHIAHAVVDHILSEVT